MKNESEIEPTEKWQEKIAIEKELILNTILVGTLNSCQNTKGFLY
jgi:hypothetical protein